MPQTYRCLDSGIDKWPAPLSIDKRKAPGMLSSWLLHIHLHQAEGKPSTRRGSSSLDSWISSLPWETHLQNHHKYTNIVSHSWWTLSSTNFRTANLQEYPAAAHNPASESHTQGEKKTPIEILQLCEFQLLYMQLTSHNHSTKNLNLREQNGTLFCNTLAQPLLMFAPRALHDVSIVLTIHFLTLCNMSTSNTVQYKGMCDISPSSQVSSPKMAIPSPSQLLSEW